MTVLGKSRYPCRDTVGYEISRILATICYPSQDIHTYPKGCYTLLLLVLNFQEVCQYKSLSIYNDSQLILSKTLFRDTELIPVVSDDKGFYI